jgi:hypothetical protein
MMHGPQSTVQLEQFSSLWQTESPQFDDALQSSGQVMRVSVPLHTPSPHIWADFGHWPQSCGQSMQVSAPLQRPSPHVGGSFGHVQQSAGHLEQFSPVSHISFPQTGGHGPQSIMQL